MHISGLVSSFTVTGTTRYQRCPGNSASHGCVVGALIAPGALSSLTVPLVPPGTLLTPRLNQVDLSIGKRITIGRLKLDPKLDLFNALNSDDYYTVRSTTFSRLRAGRRRPASTARAAAGQHSPRSHPSHRRGD